MSRSVAELSVYVILGEAKNLDCFPEITFENEILRRGAEAPLTQNDIIGVKMADARGETHGCIVCGKLYQLYVVHDSEGKYIGSKVMTAGGKEVTGYGRPLVACEKHSPEEIARAVERVYGLQKKDE